MLKSEIFLDLSITKYIAIKYIQYVQSTNWNSIFDKIAFSRHKQSVVCTGQDDFLRCQHYDRGHNSCPNWMWPQISKYILMQGFILTWIKIHLCSTFKFLPKYLGSLHFLESTIVHTQFVCNSWIISDQREENRWSRLTLESIHDMNSRLGIKTNLHIWSQ